MSDIAYKYFTQLDSLDLSDLEILFGKISSLIFSKKNIHSHETEGGLAFFDSIKGSVDKEINAEEELASALDEKYAYSH